MTAFIPILNSEVAPGAAVSSSLLTRLRDNLNATAEGAAGATPIYGGAIGIGGTGLDGSLNNAYTFSGNGYYEFTDINLTSAKTFPSFAVMRVQGNVTISAAITVSQMTLTERTNLLSNGSIGTPSLSYISTAGIGAVTGGSGSGGGGGWATGGVSNTGGGAGIGGGVNFSFRRNELHEVKASLAGFANTNIVKPGGILIILADGDVTLTGATISANGETLGGASSGGGGGGSIYIASAGTITGGTLNGKGGDGGGSSGGGGGGLISLFGATVSGVTASVSGGSGVNAGGTGLVRTLTGLTPGQLRTLVRGI